MNIQLDAVEARVLGCLIEKELTTPEYYPLTLNSLTAACNQKSNRFPVMSVSDTEAARALDRLRTKHLAREVHLAGSRVPKYENKAAESWELVPQEVAILCVLLLRGPQTAGELKSRSARMFAFESRQEVNEVLGRLEEHAAGSFIRKLTRQPGHKECRFMHLLSGEPEVEDLIPPTLRPDPAMLQVRAEDERIAALETAVQSIRHRLDALEENLEEFKSQFE